MTENLTNKVIDFSKIRSEFPILEKKINNHKMVYLDSAASAQKPKIVIETIENAYLETYSNVHRGLHWLSEQSTFKYEEVRKKAANFLGANNENEIIFGSGATQLINLIANSWGRKFLKQDDEIIITIADHHANIVPWQLISQQTGAKIKAIPVDENGEFNINSLKSLINKKTKIVSVPHVSNVLGTIFPIKEISRLAHEANAICVVDGCQGAIHLPVNVIDIGCDFYTFSSHKLYGPSGVGVLWGRSSILNDMPPFIGGGDMIDNVDIESSTYADPPHRFEAGTPPIAEVIAFGSAIDFVQAIGMTNIQIHEQKILKVFTEKLEEVNGLKIIGNSKSKSGVISFVFENAHPHDIATILDQKGIAIRAGHHCAQPLMKHFNITSTARASIGIYTQEHEVDDLINGLTTVKKLLG
tara:strand:+ start:1083 stop:2324 length:1242 start_codon:yes stop_codon:yes gene_type:complete